MAKESFKNNKDAKTNQYKKDGKGSKDFIKFSNTVNPLSTQAVTAATSCCACGGGDRSVVMWPFHWFALTAVGSVAWVLLFWVRCSIYHAVVPKPVEEEPEYESSEEEEENVSKWTKFSSGVTADVTIEWN